MTHDEMIEAERRIIALHRGYAEGSRQFAEIMTGQWDALFESDILLIRAAIRVIAPAVLEDAANKAVSFLVGDPKNGVPLHNPSPHQISDEIRALKPRYEQ